MGAGDGPVTVVDVVSLVDDVMRVVALLAFGWFGTRWALHTRWWVYWDTRALFALFVIIGVLVLWSIIVQLGWIPESWRPWVTAITWSLIAGAGLFLAVGYEREEHVVRRLRAQVKRDPAQHADDPH